MPFPSPYSPGGGLKMSEVKFRIIGLDMATYKTGFCVLDCIGPGQFEVDSYGTLVSPDKEDKTNKLRVMAEKIDGVIRAHSTHPATFVASESLISYGAVGSRINSLIPIAKLHGIVEYLELQRGIILVHVAPSQVKKAVTGSGRASKPSVRAAASSALGVPLTEDEADAYGVALATAVVHEDLITKTIKEMEQ